MDTTLPRKFSVMGFQVERNEPMQRTDVYSDKGKLLYSVADYTWAHWEREVELAMSR